jgi:hypothetical protein
LVGRFRILSNPLTMRLIRARKSVSWMPVRFSGRAMSASSSSDSARVSRVLFNSASHDNSLSSSRQPMNVVPLIAARTKQPKAI